MKIVYVIDSLASRGGAERILLEKMNYLALHDGYEVYVITCYQNSSREPNAYPLSEKVHQIDLNIPYYSQYHYRYPVRLWKKWQIYRSFISQLTATVQSIDPDILTGLGYFQADVVTGIRCRAKKIVELHEARLFTMSDHGLNRSLFSRLFMRLFRWSYFRAVERQADVVVSLTKGDAYQWRKARRVEMIPNFTMMPVAEDDMPREKRVIAVGRLEWQKGFDRLIDLWAVVGKHYPDWRLDIFGSGTLQNALQHQIMSLGLENQVSINSFTEHIREEYLRSSVFVLTSRFEGFSLVLLEAAQSGLPSVAFDCPFGPSDLIEDGQTGFLVPDGDTKVFAERLETLLVDESLRQHFSQRAVRYVQKFQVQAVMQQWKTLFETLCQTA